MTVTIRGSGFAGTTVVAFNGRKAAHYQVVSASKIVATIAMGTTTGRIAVRTPAGLARSPRSFTVLAGTGPAVKLSPSSGPPGTTTTVTGSGFGADEIVDLYFDTSDQVLTTTSSRGSFKASLTVPVSATPGDHWITGGGRHTGLASQASFLVQANWPQFGNTATHRGFNTAENVLNPSNVGQLDLNWTHFIGGLPVTSSPVVANGIVYVGSGVGKLYALDAATGKQLWVFTTGGSVNTSAAVANGVVYVGSTTDMLYALNATTGKQVWAFAAGQPILTSPSVANGVVYFGSNDHNLYAVNATTGKQVWAFAAAGTISSSPAVANGIVYFGANNDEIYAVHAATGKQAWLQGTGAPVTSSPAVADGIVFFGGNDNNFYALNAGTGQLAWDLPTSSPFPASPVVADGTVYIGRSDGTVFAMNAATGTSLWSYAAGSAVQGEAVADGVVYISTANRNLDALNASSGAVLLQYFTGGGFASAPVVANGMVYVGGADGNVYAFGLAGGADRPRAAHRPDPAQLRPNLRLRVRN